MRVLRLLTVVLGLVVSVLVIAGPSPASAATSCLFAAHRGYTANAPENSLRAFRFAVARGADYLEMDVQSTSDGQFVAMHDETVDRTTDGRGRILNKTAAQVSRLRLSDGSAPPTLQQVLAEAKPKGVQILLEMKWIPSSRFAALHRIVTDYGQDRVVVHSFSRWVVSHYRAAYPQARTGLDVSQPVSVRTARSYGGVLPDYRHVTDGWIDALRTAGVPTYLATLNSAATWLRFRGRVSVVITDKSIDYATWRTTSCA